MAGRAMCAQSRRRRNQKVRSRAVNRARSRTARASGSHRVERGYSPRAEARKPMDAGPSFHAAAENAARVRLLEETPCRARPAGSNWCWTADCSGGWRPFCSSRYLEPAHDRRRNVPRSACAGPQAAARNDSRNWMLSRIGDPEASLAAMVEIALAVYVELSAFARDRALSATQIQEMIERRSIVVSQTAAGAYAMSAPVWLELKRTCSQSFRPSIRTIPICRASASNACGGSWSRGCRRRRCLGAAGPVRSKDIVFDGAWVRLASHEVRLTDEDERLWTRIAPMLAGAERFRRRGCATSRHCLACARPRCGAC